MARVAVVGAGLGGLAAALFLARRGHRIDLFERDAGEPAADPGERRDDWMRRGVPQARQPHLFLGLSRQVLKDEAPDVLEALAEAGCGETRMAGAVGEDPQGRYLITVASRLTYEAVLRRIVRQEAAVAFHAGVAIAGLTARNIHDIPQVTGVRADTGAAHDADLVVDASGRWSQAADWLAQIGARPWTEQVQETPFIYLTRWFRLKPGAAFPQDATGIRAVLTFGAAFVFPADNGCFSMTLMLTTSDPLRGAAKDPAVFDAVMAALPAMAPWLAAGEALTRPQPLGRIDNRLRRLADDKGLVVSGLVLLADSAIHTNPTLGRGVSLAFAHAQQLARTADLAARDPAAFSQDFDAWTQAHLAVWLESQVVADGHRVAEIQACLEGHAPPTPPRSMRIMGALMAMGAQDPAAARALNQQAHLFARPAELLADESLADRVEAHLMKTPSPAKPDMDRAAFERLVAPITV